MKITRHTVLAALITLICAASAQAALVPFTATSEPNFSKTLSIYVPDGWTHRNAEGMMELKPPSGDGWLSVEVGNLAYDMAPVSTPTAWALLLAEGQSVQPADGSTNCCSWSDDDGYGTERGHYFAASPEQNIYVHFTWTVGLCEVTADIQQGSRIAGEPMSSGIHAGAQGRMNEAEVKMMMAFAKFYDERAPHMGGHDPRIALSYVFADTDQRELNLDRDRLRDHHNWSGGTSVLRDAGGKAIGIECAYAEGNVYQHHIVGAIDAQGAAWVVEEAMGGSQISVKLYKNGAETKDPAPRELVSALEASEYKYLLGKLNAAK